MPLSFPVWSRDERLLAGIRAIMVVGGGSLLLLSDQSGTSLLAVTLLAALAAIASTPLPWAILRPFQAPLEAVLACLVMLLAASLPESLLPYLLAPALAAGLFGGIQAAVTTAGLAGLTLLSGRLFRAEATLLADYLSVISRWILITLAIGLIGAWVQRLQSLEARPENAAYAAAYQLISQLRLVARQLSGGLDPVSLAQHLLERLQSQVSFDRGAVYVRSSGGRLTPIAFAGSDRLDWAVDNPLFDEAWAASTPVRGASAFSDGMDGHAVVLPLHVGLRTFGLVALERSAPAYVVAELADLDPLVEEQSLRLETALLFTEVRTLATAEERRRLAREIHDGIAQELASLGYVVDDLATRARFLPDLEQDLKALRGELTRVISELRLSIFDLRSEVQTTVGLGTAVSDYVRQVGAGSNLTVHLVLDESPMRLPIEAETELLRIAQEAVTNARKHADASNLWVTCRVDPPSALLLVEDDGTGLGLPRADSFGLEVMRERAARIGARLTVKNREEGGTSVEVVLGSVRTAH